MKAASLSEIRRQLGDLDNDALELICLKLARYKKENKELLTYLLFEAQDEAAYVSAIKAEVDIMFETVPRGNVYFIKKSIRKILRFVNRQVKYSGIPATELEVRLHFCLIMKSTGVPLNQGTVLGNLYQQQFKKIVQIHSKLEEDLKFDYQSDLDKLSS